jgi:putative addiction module component (TIGR02574 family)
MNMPQEQIFESALALPQTARADLVFQLLQTLRPDGREITSEEFGTDLHQRIAAYRRGDLSSYSLEDVRAHIEKRLSKDDPS